MPQSPLAAMSPGGMQMPGPSAGGGGMPPMSGAGPAGGPQGGGKQQVQVQFKAGPNQTIIMSINAPDGSADFTLDVQTAAGALLQFAKALGDATGVDISSMLGGDDGGGRSPGGLSALS